jgi:hypothetical protein
MSARFVLAGALALAASSLAGAARADVPPSPVEQPCDLDRSSALAGTCQACEADFMDARSCERVLRPLGFHRHCRGLGLLQWTEVWCRGAPAQAAASAAPSAPAAPLAPATAPTGEAPEAPSASATASNAGGSSPGPRAQAERGAGGAVDPLLWTLPAGAVGTLALLAALRRRRRTVASRSGERPRSDSGGT